MLDRLFDFSGSVFRNIASLRVSENLFDDLLDDAGATGAAMAADMAVKGGIPTGIIHRGLHYSQAIDYPFSADACMSSRYGDGSIAVWYGALEEDTAIHETCFHALRLELATGKDPRPVVRERAMYRVQANGLFVDLRGKQSEHPELVGDDYAATQAIGKRAANQGMPGLIYPSARREDGECLAAFRADVLSDPALVYYLTYTIDPSAHTVRIERAPGVVIGEIHWSQLRGRRA